MITPERIESLAIVLFVANGFARDGWSKMSGDQGEHVRGAYRNMAEASLRWLDTPAIDPELTAAWKGAMGLIICRNRSRDDMDTVEHFWRLMNYRTGCGREPEEAKRLWEARK